MSQLQKSEKGIKERLEKRLTRKPSYNNRGTSAANALKTVFNSYYFANRSHQNFDIIILV